MDRTVQHWLFSDVPTALDIWRISCIYRPQGCIHDAFSWSQWIGSESMAVQSAANPPLTCGPKLPWPAGQRKPRKPYPPRHDHVRGIVVADIVVASAKADATIYCHPHPLNNLLQPTHTSICVQALRSPCVELRWYTHQVLSIKKSHISQTCENNTKIIWKNEKWTYPESSGWHSDKGTTLGVLPMVLGSWWEISENGDRGSTQNFDARLVSIVVCPGEPFSEKCLFWPQIQDSHVHFSRNKFPEWILPQTLQSERSMETYTSTYTMHIH